MKGRIITIEGMDGSGKSTQIDLLSKKLDTLNMPHKFIHFPMLNKGEYGKIIAQFLRGEFGEINEVHPKLVALLFAEDRKEHKAKLIEWLNQGYLIILDRYVKSNIAFQCAKLENYREKEILKQWILDFEFGHNQLPKPEASFFLNVPISLVEKNLKHNRAGEDRAYLEGKSDIHESSIEFQKKVLNEYLQLLEEDQNFHEIKCCTDNEDWLTTDVIHKALLDKIL